MASRSSTVRTKLALSLSAVATLALAGCTLGAQAPSLEETARQLYNASDGNDGAAVWELMHPDDKARWESSEEYIALYTPLHADTGDVTTFKESKDLSTWTHPITGKVYTNLKEIVSTTAKKPTGDSKGDPAEPTEDTSYFQQVDGRWYFFSTGILSAKDRAAIKSSAPAGPAYKELKKNAEKFSGQQAKYTGQVLEIYELADGSGYLRLGVTKDEFGGWSDDVVWVHYSQPTSAVQEDVVTVYGILNGTYTYTSQANYEITVPYLEAAEVEKP